MNKIKLFVYGILTGGEAYYRAVKELNEKIEVYSKKMDEAVEKAYTLNKFINRYEMKLELHEEIEDILDAYAISTKNQDVINAYIDIKRAIALKYEIHEMEIQ